MQYSISGIDFPHNFLAELYATTTKCLVGPWDSCPAAAGGGGLAVGPPWPGVGWRGIGGEGDDDSPPAEENSCTGRGQQQAGESN